jgi:septal ring factor EnvC (AmiA/AmiB activator)
MKDLETLVQSPFLWSILCLLAVYFFYKQNTAEVDRLRKQNDTREKSITKLYEDHKKEANTREEKLMNHLEKTTTTLGHIEKGLSKLENKIDGGFKEIWEQIDSIKKGES